jgi:hypothetical protein
MNEPNLNSTEATRGQPLVARIDQRRRELEAVAKDLPTTNHTRQDIDAALAAVAGLLTGDLDHIPETVALDLSQWLERNKYLGEQHGVVPVPTGRADDRAVEEKSAD